MKHRYIVVVGFKLTAFYIVDLEQSLLLAEFINRDHAEFLCGRLNNHNEESKHVDVPKPLEVPYRPYGTS